MNALLKLLANKRLQTIVFLLFLVFAVLVLYKSNKRLRIQNARMAANVQTISAAIEYVKTQNGKLAAQTDVLLLRTGELKGLFPVQAKTVTDMGVKLNRATQLSTTVIESQKNIITLVRDSIIRDTIHVKVFEYADRWYHIKGISQGDSQSLQIHTTDTLTQVVFKGEREKPWLWIFSPRRLQQRVSVSNPNSTIRYSQFIQIIKP
jgi:hypothetical protein